MKLASVASMVLLGVTGQALAADLPMPGTPSRTSYVPATAPFNSWGGVYLGLNGGYAFGSSDWTLAGASSGNFNTNGFLFGGTLGANFQAGQFVIGFEGDVDWSGVAGSSSVAGCAAVGAPAGSACTTKSEWLSTARARGGYAFDRFLLFATAGLALTNVQLALTQPAVSTTIFQTGWTAGGGAEVAFTDGWTAKVEYLFIDFGSVSCGLFVCGVGTASLKENLIRGGINYKFSW